MLSNLLKQSELTDQQMTDSKWRILLPQEVILIYFFTGTNVLVLLALVLMFFLNYYSLTLNF